MFVRALSLRFLPAAALVLAVSSLPAAAEAMRCSFDKICGKDGCKTTAYAFRLDWTGEDGRFQDEAGRSGDVSVAEMEAFWHFIEILEKGDLVLTSVANGGEAVHSKHALLGGTFTPVQYYGQCRMEK